LTRALVAIPSYYRPYDIERTTGHWLHKLPAHIDWKVFVRKEQMMYYEQTIRFCNLVPIEATSFRTTVNAYAEYARKHEYDIVFRVDDDMSFKTRNYSRKEDVHLAFQYAYDRIVQEFDNDPKLGAVSICKPRPFYFHKSDSLWAGENKPLFGNHVMRTELIGMPEGVELMDDIWHSLVCREQGYTIRRFMGAYENAMSHKNQGGMQTMDRNQATVDTIKVIAQHFPHRNIAVSTYKDTDVADIDLKKLDLS
jgi:hypothetical protein